VVAALYLRLLLHAAVDMPLRAFPAAS